MITMVTISHIVTKLINDNIYLQEAIGKGIASYGSVAKKLKPEIEIELNKEVAHYAIVAAIRRYSEKMNYRFQDIKFNANSSEVNLKTNVMDINVLRRPSLFDKLKRIYDIIQFEKGDKGWYASGFGFYRKKFDLEEYKRQLVSFLEELYG